MQLRSNRRTLVVLGRAAACLWAVALARAVPLAPWRWRLAPRLLARPAMCRLLAARVALARAAAWPSPWVSPAALAALWLCVRALVPALVVL